MERKVISVVEAAHRIVEEAFKKGGPVVSNRKRKVRTPAEEEAVRLRTETAARERMDFGAKNNPAHFGRNDDEAYVAPEDTAQEEMYRLAYSPEAYEQIASPGSSRTGYSIMEEINEAITNRKLRPFVEGEPIGVIQKHDPKPAPMLMTHNEIMDERQKELRARQKQNDATLTNMLRRLK